MVSGQYVNEFSEASHALVVGINLDARWEHSILTIKSLTPKQVTLRDCDGSLIIHKDKAGREYVNIMNTCPIGSAMGAKPSRHRVYPFKDRHTPAIGEKGQLFSTDEHQENEQC